MKNRRKKKICRFCWRWHPSLKYSPLYREWFAVDCLLNVLKKNPKDQEALDLLAESEIEFVDEAKKTFDISPALN